MTHEDFADIPGAWAVTPLLLGNGRLLESAVGNAAKLHLRNEAPAETDENSEESVTSKAVKWLIVCEATSRVNLKRLVEHLERENHEEVSGKL